MKGRGPIMKDRGPEMKDRGPEVRITSSKRIREKITITYTESIQVISEWSWLRITLSFVVFFLSIRCALM